MLASRRRWYSLSVSVCAGATVVADHLHLEFLPTQHRLFDQHFVYGRQIEAAFGDLFEFFLVVGDAATGAAEGETGANDGGVTDLRLNLQGLLEVLRHFGLRAFQADLPHRHAEQFAVLGHANRFTRSTDQFDPVLLQHAVVGQIERAVQRGLAAHRRQQRIGFFLGDDLLDRLPVDRLDIDRVRHIRIGHDRRRIAVDQHHAIPLVAQRFAGLRARVIEFAGLADHDRAGADDQDGLDVGALRHFGHQSSTIGES
jgi:hypothetical protein